MMEVGDYIPNVGGAVYAAEFYAIGDTVRLHGHHNGDIILVAAPMGSEAEAPPGYTLMYSRQGVTAAWKVLCGDDSVTWPGAHAIKVMLFRKTN